MAGVAATAVGTAALLMQPVFFAAEIPAERERCATLKPTKNITRIGAVLRRKRDRWIVGEGGRRMHLRGGGGGGSSSFVKGI